MPNSIRDALLNAAINTSQDNIVTHMQDRAHKAKPRERNQPRNGNVDGLTVAFSKNHNPGAPMLQNASSDIVTAKMSVLEDDYSVVFTLDGEDELDIHSDNKLFFVLREALAASKGANYFLMVKFARRITERAYPCLQDPATLMLYFDPLMPFRDALEAFKETRTITLLKVPSSGEFYRKLDKKRFDRNTPKGAQNHPEKD